MKQTTKVLQPGESQVMIFPFTPTEAGDYSVNINNLLAGGFTARTEAPPVCGLDDRKCVPNSGGGRDLYECQMVDGVADWVLIEENSPECEAPPEPYRIHVKLLDAVTNEPLSDVRVAICAGGGCYRRNTNVYGQITSYWSPEHFSLPFTVEVVVEEYDFSEYHTCEQAVTSIVLEL